MRSQSANSDWPTRPTMRSLIEQLPMAESSSPLTQTLALSWHFERSVNLRSF